MKYFAILFLLVFLVSCSPVRGIMESRFDLADDSPLPTWVLPLKEGCERKNMSVRLEYWSPLIDVDDVVLIANGKNCKSIKKTGRSQRPAEWWTLAQVDWPNRHYPSFNIVMIDGKSEIVEHKKMEPIFYIANEAAIQDTVKHLRSLEQ